MEEVRTDSELQAQYIARNPVSRVIQCAAVQSENEVSELMVRWWFNVTLTIDKHNPGWLYISRNEPCRGRLAKGETLTFWFIQTISCSPGYQPCGKWPDHEIQEENWERRELCQHCPQTLLCKFNFNLLIFAFNNVTPDDGKLHQAK